MEKKVCASCKYYSKEKNSLAQIMVDLCLYTMWCNHFDTVWVNIITGERGRRTCTAARYNHDSPCGRDGKLFESGGVSGWVGPTWRGFLGE